MMKVLCFTILLFLVSTLGGFAQPSEEIYKGNIAKSGYANDGFFGPFETGFDFTFYGDSYSQFYVSPNGLVTFNTGQDSPVNESIPSGTPPNNFIAPFWDDLVVDPFGSILYKTIGAAPNRKLIIQFRNMAFFSSPSFLGTFSVILYESTYKIQSQYRLIVLKDNPRSGGNSATIGVENITGTSGTLHGYLSPDAVSTSKAISFTPSGGTYLLDADAMYYGVYLTTNTILPEPGICDLISPTEGAIAGIDNTFEWTAAPNTHTYALQLATNPDLISAISYNAGSELSYTLKGLLPETTYYWTVFTSNTTGTTWSEVKSFTTSSTPPLIPVPRTIWAEQLQDKTIKLQYTGGDASPKTAIITTLPLQGQLYQYNAGIRGAQISSVPATITDAGRNVIYATTGSPGNGTGNFNFKLSDAGGDSPEGTITINVSPPGIPNVLYTAKSTTAIEIQFDIAMADPAGKQDQFTVTVDGTPVTISTAALKAGDPNTIILNLASSLTGTETVLVSYTQGDVSGATGGILFSFSDQPVTLRSQIITFPVIPEKQYGNPAFNPGASSNSGLTLTYSSSNLGVATVAGSSITIRSAGSCIITATQAGNATYAPAKHVKTLTVIKADQIISFGPLPDKTYTSADFALTATSGSGLLISYSSNNPAVATVSGNMVHIVGVGSATITASQAGNNNYNPAPDKSQTLNVLKADQTITFGILPDLNYGDSDFTPTVSASSGLSVTLSSDNPSVATILNGTIHIAGAGSAIITASQTGNDNYNPATDVPQTLNVLKADQTITFGILPDMNYGDSDFTTTVSASSGLSVTLTSDNPSVATILNGNIHITGAGSAIITASQTGNSNYNPAAEVPQTLNVLKADQTITFGILPHMNYGDSDFTPTVSASSGLSVTLTSDNASVATIINGNIHITGAGSATITASQPGGLNYNPAPLVPGDLSVNKADLTFTADDKSREYLSPNPDLTYSVSGFVNGDTQQDLDILPSIQTSADHNSSVFNYPITISGGSDNNYNYLFVPGILTVTKLQQTITFSDIPLKLLVGETFMLNATSTSGLMISFESQDASIASVNGDNLTGLSKGYVEIRAYHPGDINYYPAEAFATIEIHSTHKDIMNLFTPNNDGINDLWELPGLSEWGKCDVKVYNRWGKLVYADPDYNNDWNGMSDGKPVPEGPYYFVIKTLNAGTVKGTVNIVR